MSKIKVLIIGGGGVGTMAAYALETGGKAQVTMVLRSNFAAVQQNGFTIDSIQHGHDIKNWKPSYLLNAVPDAQDSSTPAYDYIIAATKNIPEVKPTVVDIFERAVTPGKTTILLLQNGLNIEKPVFEKFPSNIVLSGVSLIGATETQHGVIRHDDTDDCKVGPFTPSSTTTASPPQPSTTAESSARALVEAYNASHKVTWSYDENVPFTRWRKLLYNSSFNSVAAMTGMDTARMRMSEFVIDDLILPIMREIKSVAKAAGVILPEGVEEKVVRVDPTDTAFVPSMGQDAAKGNFMEVEVIVGEPVREGRRLGVPVPTLESVYGFLKAKQLQVMEKKGLWEAKFGEEAKYS
jgi:2-dehydropantoate 2-reductase